MPLTVKSNLARRLTPFLILSATGACAINTTAPVSTNSYCAIAKPIFYDSKQDSAQTVKDIEAHNSRYECVCNNDCPKKP